MLPESKLLSRVVIALTCVIALALAPTLLAQVEVTIDVTGTATPGGTVTATVVDVSDGSTPVSYSWSQTHGISAMVSGTETASAMATLGTSLAYKGLLFDILAEPPIGPDQLPPNVPVPPSDFPGGQQDRFEVVGLNPFSLEEAALVVLEVVVTTNTGTYIGEAEIHTVVPWKSAAGIKNVSLGRTVLLHGKDQEAYDWVLDAPGASSATLMDASTQYPEFIPDVDGEYTVTVTDTTGDEDVVVELAIHSGSYRGVIVGQDAEGRPVSDSACTGCHSGSIAPDKFTPWAQTGHAEAHTDNLDASPYYGERCFGCHTVGYDTDVTNGGMDDAPDYQAFLDSGLIGNPGDNWTQVLDQFPETAQLSNIQCENCHGPQGGNHMNSESRTSLSSNTCGTCHGEPLRHGRFQQWQLSAHSDYDVAMEEGTRGSCSKCHTANGFLAWLEILTDDDPATGPEDDPVVTWTIDEIHPQTCVTCHDPHDTGTTTGVDTDTTVRIYGDTPPLASGITITDVGNGAICATCHNSRRGLRNDSNWAESDTKSGGRSPHGGPQSDIMMGENAYLVEVGNRASHSITALVEDTCVTCHMETTPPPDDLAYNGSGTNHTFYASPDICSACHGEGADAGDLIQDEVNLNLDVLQFGIESGYLAVMEDLLAAGNSIDLDGDHTVTSIMEIVAIEALEYRGRQALQFELTSAELGNPIQVRSINVVPSSGEPHSIQDDVSDELAKSFWNYLMVHNDGSQGVHHPSFVQDILDSSIAALGAEPEPCIPDAETVCLVNDRFRVKANWATTTTSGTAKVSGLSLNEGEVFYFFNEANPEMLVKVKDACNFNDRFWVFMAATTNVEFTLTITDSQTGQTWEFNNPQGTPAPPIQDTDAFATCP